MIIFLLLMLAASCSAYSATYVVAPNGKAVAAGTLEFPLNSIGAAVAKAKAGDTVLVRGGTYHEAVTVSQSGTAAAPIKLQAYRGESPVLDGQNRLPAEEWYALIHLSGSYIDVAGFELKNSAQRGMVLAGQHNSAHKMNVHHAAQNGILLEGDYGLVEDSQVYQAALANYQGAGNGRWAAGMSAARDPVNGIADGAILRRNIVYNNWGEGLSTFEADGTVIEDNIVYDNMKVNLYVSDATHTVVQRNLIYSTADSVILFGHPAQGIGMANETAKNPLNHITIVNNVVYGTAAPFVYFPNLGPNTLGNTLIANNTFVSSLAAHPDSVITVVFSGGTFTNVRFINNLVMQEDSSSVVFVAQGQTGLTFNSNLWSKTPQSAAFASNDRVGDPLLAKTGLTTASQPAAGSRVGSPMIEAKPGLLRAEAFRPTAGSPAIGNGAPISEVTTDYYRASRGQKPTIGAIAAPAP